MIVTAIAKTAPAVIHISASACYRFEGARQPAGTAAT
jgi:hypothetical protein